MKNWMFAQGLLAIVMGVVLIPLAWAAVPALASMGFALYLLMDSLLIYFAGQQAPGASERNSPPLKIEGVLAIVFGLCAIVRELKPVITAPQLFGIWFVIAGLLNLASSLKDRDRLEHPTPYIASGIFSIIAGAFLLVKPIGGTAQQFVLSIYLIVFGALTLMSAVRHNPFARHTRRFA